MITIEAQVCALVASIDPPPEDWELSRAVPYVMKRLRDLRIEDLQAMCRHYSVGVDDLILGLVAKKLGHGFHPYWTQRHLDAEAQLAADEIIE